MFVNDKTCIYSTAPQLSEEWHKLHIASLSASKLSTWLGLTPFSKGFEASALECLGLEKPVFSKEAQERMNIGIYNEAPLREWYSNFIGNKIEEVGIAVWKANPLFRASLDGVYNIVPSFDSTENKKSGVEFKITAGLYSPLMQHHQALNRGYNPPGASKVNSQGHIWTSHYNQMIQCIAITGMESIDYVVSDYTSNKTYIEKINPNPQHWESLVEKGVEFHTKYLEPLMLATGIQRYDPPATFFQP